MWGEDGPTIRNDDDGKKTEEALADLHAVT